MRLIELTIFILICNIVVETKRRTKKPKSVTKKPVVVELEEWEKITVHMVPPSKWETLEIPQRIKSYMEHTWSQSSYTDKCSEDNPLHIIPVYFWPGDKVDLPCLMCELAFVFNGKMKMWGKVTNILKFLENPKRTARYNSKYWSLVANLDRSAQNASSDIIDYMPEVLNANKEKINYKKLPPFYLQRNGKLSIFRASPASQGVYFCYDSQSRSHTSIFYVVMAMTPPVRMSEMADVLADGCKGEVDHKLIRANFNWRYHFVPQVRHEAPKQCKHKKTRQKTDFCKEAYYTRYTPEKDCTLEYCRKEFIVDRFDLNVAVELRWEPWTKCEGNMALQKREAHCYLVRKTGYEIPIADDERVPETLKWMSELNVLFDREPFTSKGIRLYSSLLASLFLDEEMMTKCHYEEKRLKTDQIWREILSIMGAKYADGGKILQLDENGGLLNDPESLRLTNAFQACMVYEYNKERDFEHVVGTYMTETRPCG